MDWTYFKENVSIIQLVETLGYSYNYKKGRNPKQYEHPNGDKVIISDKVNSNMEVYFTRDKHDDNGTVVDFVKNRLSMFNVHYNSEWEGVVKVLTEFAGKSQQLDKATDIQSTKLEKFNSEDFIIRQAELKNLTYLRFERRLNRKTLQAFLPYIQTVLQKGKPFQNIGFPYTLPKDFEGQSDPEGYEVVNYAYKGHAKGTNRSEAVWIASLSQVPQLIRDVYFAESAIDAMSFYQLYNHKYNFERAVFFSTGGSVLKNQVKNVLQAFPNAKIHTIFDNDFGGKMYDVFLATLKSNKEVSITKNKDTVTFKLDKGIFQIAMDQLSLSKFERLTGIRSAVRVHKSDGKDFNEILQRRSTKLSNKGGLRRK